MGKSTNMISPGDCSEYSYKIPRSARNAKVKGVGMTKCEGLGMIKEKGKLQVTGDRRTGFPIGVGNDSRENPPGPLC
jgi:hypothetical protein